MSKKNLSIIGGVAIILVLVSGLLFVSKNKSKAEGTTAPVELCASHGFGKHNCYQCNPDLLQEFKSSLDWCTEHNLPESQCELCDPFAKFKAKGDWCKEHGAPESQCVKCDPSLASAQPQFVDWCDEHEIAESQCTICNPNLRTSMKSDWCQEHNTRDSECLLCHPELRGKSVSTASSGTWCEHGFDAGTCYRCDNSLAAKFKDSGDWCGGHDLPESQCLKCQADVKEEVERRLALSAQPSPVGGAAAASWCEHGFDTGTCYLCDNSLAAKFKASGDWCGGHDLPESQCLKCQPDVKARVEKRLGTVNPTTAVAASDEDYPEGDWCEHGFEEGNCYRCDAGLEAKFKSSGDWCGGHGLPESQCLKCQADVKAEVERRLMVSTPRPELLDSKSGIDVQGGAPGESVTSQSKFCGTHLLRIKLSDPKIADRVGLKIAPARERGINQTIQANAEVSYNRKRMAQLASRFGGVVRSINTSIGSKVKEGEVLAVIESPELGEAKVEVVNTTAAHAATTLVHDQQLRISAQTRELLSAVKAGGSAEELLANWHRFEAGKAQSLLLAAISARERARLKLVTRKAVFERSKPIAENIRKLHAYLEDGSKSAESAIADMKRLEIGIVKSALMKKLGAMELTQSIFEREKQLLKEKIGSKQAFQRAKMDYEVAVAEYDALLEQALVNADTALSENEGDFKQAKNDFAAADSSFNSLIQELKVENERALLSAKKDLLMATSRMSAARSRLSLLGFSNEDIANVGNEAPAEASRYLVRAPFDGTIIELTSVNGELVEAGTPMFVVANLSTLWVKIDLLERDLRQLQGRDNLPVRFVTDGLKGESFEGRLIWLGTEINDKTRTVQALAEVQNVDGLLRANMFGRASILVRQKEKVITVPKEAVQWEGCCHVVFVQLKNDLYAPRKVRLGYEGKDFYEVKVGLLNADPIVTQGSFLLKTEILKSSIGAGCTD